MADLPQKKPVPSRYKMSPMENESFIGLSDLPKRKPVPPVPYGDNDVNDYMQGKTNKKQLLARVDDRFGRKDPMEYKTTTQNQFRAQVNDRYGRKDPMEDRSDEEQNLSQKMRNMGFKKGGVVKGKSVPQSQKKNRKKG